jgi:aromatic ring hydroxylase
MLLARDVIWTEFDIRYRQYEKIYRGASHSVKMNLFRSYDFQLATAMVGGALNLPTRAEGATHEHVRL